MTRGFKWLLSYDINKIIHPHQVCWRLRVLLGSMMHGLMLRFIDLSLCLYVIRLLQALFPWADKPITSWLGVFDYNFWGMLINIPWLRCRILFLFILSVLLCSSLEDLRETIFWLKERSALTWWVPTLSAQIDDLCSRLKHISRDLATERTTAEALIHRHTTELEYPVMAFRRDKYTSLIGLEPEVS